MQTAASIHPDFAIPLVDQPSLATMPDSAILVPLYIYPFPGAWEPLYTAIEANPRTQFLVIVNPGNGPGPAPLPDANYCREIPKLKSHSNVAVFGYVHVNWARRRLDEVCKDVEIYAAWPVQQQQQQQGHLDTQQPPHQDQDVSDGRLAIDGIFVDETPIEAREHEVAFLGSLTKLAHSIWPSVPAAATSGTPVSDSGSAAKIPTVRLPGFFPILQYYYGGPTSVLLFLTYAPYRKRSPPCPGTHLGHCAFTVQQARSHSA